MLLQILLKLHEHRGDRIREKSSCERFCRVPNAENYCWSKIGNGVISVLWLLRCHWTLIMKNFHLNTTVVAIFLTVRFFCDLVYAQTWYWPWRLTVSSHYGLCCCNMAPVSFRLFRKNLGNLRDFFGQMVYRPFPWQNISRTLMNHRTANVAQTPSRKWELNSNWLTVGINVARFSAAVCGEERCVTTLKTAV